MRKTYIMALTLTASANAMAQHGDTPLTTDSLNTTYTDSIGPYAEQDIATVNVTRRRLSVLRMKGAVNGTLINQDELFKAACCNLGESFVTNPSVDVNYSDAATGARQIKLLGLSGTYVQMLTENLPNFRGAAAPFALGYVPGPWMKSIQVSKGSASVRNGYESMTGQIDIEYLKPDDTPGVTLNVYGNTEGRMEANADASAHLGKGLSAEVLAHYENQWGQHDANHDGFQDMPNVRQHNLQSRWKYMSGPYIFHAGLALLGEERTSGQTTHGHDATTATAQGEGLPRFGIDISTRRYEAYMKHAFALSREHNSSIALMTSASLHTQDAAYGQKWYDVNEKNLYAQLMYESQLTPMHNLAVGLSLNHDYLRQHYRLQHLPDAAPTPLTEKETVPGAYAQYTFDWNHKLTAMAGLRIDHSSLYGTFLTPRVHLKWQPNDVLGLRASAGKGYRTVHALAENHNLLASGRQLLVADHLRQEEAWNYGLSAALNIPLLGQTLRLNAEYYYTHFGQQVEPDFDSEPGSIVISNLQGKSFSHTMQLDASYPVFRGMTLTAAYRRNIVKATYGGTLMDKPLTSSYKALVSASYKTPLGLWQADATLQLNGGGRMPTPYTLADGSPAWDNRFPAYAQLTAQLTRWFRHFSVYVGGENLTNYRQRNPVYGASNPWSNTFEPTMVWGPVTGAMAYLGVRINIGRTNI